MNKNSKAIILFSLLFFFTCHLSAQDRMAWWREARFGMFIHWGVYSVYGNVYDGLNVKGEQVHYNKVNTGYPAEWIMYGAQIPRATYRQAAAEFDASEYNPKAWVQLAKQAGMKYVVVTTKHHDGFCLFDTDYTDWNAVEASAAERDLLDELVQEVQAAGLKLGFYYSQNRDWMAEGGMGDIPELNFGLYSADKVMKYVDDLVIPQINELTSRYNFDLFWFDAPNMSNSSNAIAQKIKSALMDSQVGAHVIVNDRLYPGMGGDFSTPESDTPDIPYNGYTNNRDWEACASLNDSWGWEDTAPNRWKSSLYTISRILELNSKGGNFLLNVGPDKHGKIPEGATETLLGVGDWMSRNSSAVYGTSRNQLLNPFEFGYVTQKNEANENVHLYLHVSTGYWDEGKVYLDGVMALPESAKLLVSGQTVEVKQQNFGLEITLPEVCNEPYYTVIDLLFNELPPQKLSPPSRDGYEIRLTPFQAVTSGTMKKDYVPYAFTNWTRAAHTIDFSAYLLPGIYKVSAEYASQYNPGTIYMTVNSIKHSLPYRKTGSMDSYVVDSYDFPIEILSAGVYNIHLSREQRDEIYNIVNLRNLVFSYIPNAINTPSAMKIPGFTIDPTLVTEDYFYCRPLQYDYFRLYDISGRVHKTFEGEGNIYVDVSNLPAGIYIVQGQYGKQKIVINKSQRR